MGGRGGLEMGGGGKGMCMGGGGGEGLGVRGGVGSVGRSTRDGDMGWGGDGAAAITTLTSGALKHVLRPDDIQLRG